MIYPENSSKLMLKRRRGPAAGGGIVITANASKGRGTGKQNGEKNRN